MGRTAHLEDLLVVQCQPLEAGKMLGTVYGYDACARTCSLDLAWDVCRKRSREEAAKPVSQGGLKPLTSWTVLNNFRRYKLGLKELTGYKE